MAFKPDKYPSRVTLAFKSDFEREVFMGQLSDGWGENVCSLDWDTKLGDLDQADLVIVHPAKEDIDHAKRCEGRRLARTENRK